MIKNRRITLLSALALLPLVACGGGDAAEGENLDNVPEEERYGGTAVVGMIGDIPDISPLTSTDYNSAQLDQFVLFLPLLTYDENFQPNVPRLARSWEVNADTTLITFHLRNDVFWHDGVKTTAYDVKFSYDRARHPETGFPNTAFWTNYGEAEAVDSFTFRVALTPHAEFLDPWRSLTPAPEHILGDVPPAELRNHPFATTAPVGNGPFRFVSRAVGQNWVFAANENFPEELGGRPYLDRLVIRVIPETTTLLTELLTGGIHFYIAPPPSQVPQIESSDQTRLSSFPDRAFVIVTWNERRPPFDDVRVRRALTMGIDRASMIQGIMYGHGELANSTVPPFYWQYDATAGADLTYNPEAAKQLLADAGWIDRDGDGVVENAQGRPFRFNIATNQANSVRVDMLAKVQADLRQIGVEAVPQVIEWGTLLDRMQNPDTRDYDAVIVGWVTEFQLDDTDLFHCDKIDEPFQWAGYCDPQTDSLLNVLPLIADRETALPLWKRYQQKIAYDQPFTFLYFQQRLGGLRRSLQGFHGDARGEWVSVQDWWLSSNERGQSSTATE